MKRSDCVLHNYFGSAAQMARSLLGPDAAITGAVTYVAGGLFGRGFQKSYDDVDTKYYIFANCIPSINKVILEKWWIPSVSYDANDDGWGMWHLSVNHDPLVNGIIVVYNGSNNTWYIYVRQGSASKCDYRWTNVFNFVAGTKYHIVIVFDKDAGAGNYIKFYVDGVLQTPSALAANLTWDVTAAFRLTSYSTWFAEGGSGNTSIDFNVRVYDNVTITNEVIAKRYCRSFGGARMRR